MTVIDEITAERKRQIEVEGWTLEHDDGHSKQEIAKAAMGYTQAASMGCDMTGLPAPTYWPWEASWWKPSTARRNLIKAGALIVAEIERIDRAEE